MTQSTVHDTQKKHQRGVFSIQNGVVKITEREICRTSQIQKEKGNVFKNKFNSEKVMHTKSNKKDILLFIDKNIKFVISVARRILACKKLIVTNNFSVPNKSGSTT